MKKYVFIKIKIVRGRLIMKVKVNYEVAEIIVNMVENNLYKDWSDFESEIDKIEHKVENKLMLEFYAPLDFKTYKTVLYHSLNDLDYTNDNERVQMQYDHLKRITENKEKLSSKLSLIKAYDFKTLEKQLTEKLPSGTNVDVAVSFVFDGLNGGSIVGSNNMLLNTMLWPSNKSNLELIEGILLHEYHHIGLKHWVEKNDPNFDNYEDAKGLAKYLMTSIMAEGAATYFFNDGDDIYPLLVESHGQEMASQYRESMQNRGIYIDQYIRELESDLLYIINYKGDIKELREISNKYTFSSDSEPLDKSIGYHMCSKIDNNLGLESLLTCFEDPSEFILNYNDALDQGDVLKFGNEFLEEWSKCTS